jgi:hypothetical protein
MIVDLALQIVAFGWSPAPTAIGYLLLAITGVARACYWARVYTALGGLRAVDGVPGLPSQGPAAGAPSDALGGGSSPSGGGPPRLASPAP